MYSGQRVSRDYPHGEPGPRPRRGRKKRRSPLSFLLVGLLLGSGLGWGLRGFAAPPGPGFPAQKLPDRAAVQKSSVAAPLKTPPDCPQWIEEDFLTVNDYSRPGTRLDAVNGVVVHYVGNPGTTARQNHSYFQNLSSTGETYASSHFLIGLEGEIIQNVPLDEVAYCSSQRNSDTISIECCHPDSGGAFTRETYDSLVRLVRWLMEYYELDADQVIRHYDVTGKECPLYYVRHPRDWQAFLDGLT